MLLHIKNGSHLDNSQVLPDWYNALSPLGSVVRYIANISTKCKWVGLYLYKNKRFVLGPSIGDRQAGFLSGSKFREFMIKSPESKKALGKLELQAIAEEDQIIKIVKELENLWPE
ncbi:MAG: hypothetical protein HY072_08105 [Deltaproteobacteria bacterium]|nr:hypothetical protein [Deltaproteobacteria bacterium]